ncbi:MAG TPA: hypothetical protein VK348_13760 [Planctomycetota bacterium]|nr:hypothetical protein [Planctomycetota bacterium]
MEPGSQRPTATPMQHTVRRNGIGLFLLLIGSVPLLHFYWHGLRGNAAPIVATGAQVPWPHFGRAILSNAAWRAWKEAIEQHLREDTPVTWELRGRYNELRYRLGILQNPQIRVGKDGWLFMRHSLAPTAELLAQRAERRREIMAAVKRRADELGVALVVLLVPDKERIYPEFAYPDGAMPAAKSGLYGTILAELRAAGLTAVDTAAPLLAAKSGGELLFLRGDSHWSGRGALVYGDAVARSLEQGAFAPLLGPTVNLDLPQPTRVDVVGDLLGMCGMRSYVRPGADGEFAISLPGSPLLQELMETKEYYGLSVLAADGARIPIKTLGASAAIALAGSSFSQGNGAAAVTFFLHRPVDDRGVHSGASAFRGLREVFDRLRDGTGKARLVLWEFVERAVLEDDWLKAPPF